MRFRSEASVRTQHLLCVNSYFLFAYHLIQIPFRHCFFTVKILSADQQHRSRLTDVSLMASPMLCRSQQIKYLELKKTMSDLSLKKKIKYRQPKTLFSLKTVSLSVLRWHNVFIHTCMRIIYNLSKENVKSNNNSNNNNNNREFKNFHLYFSFLCCFFFIFSPPFMLLAFSLLFYGWKSMRTFGSMRHNDNGMWKKN